MDSRFSTFKSALNRSADSMARTLPTTTAAFSLLPSWSNSIARFFAPTVRCSICDEDVASVRSNTALMGPNVWTCSPRWCTAVSNCASVTEASSISAMSGAGTSRVRSLSVIGTAPPTVESMCCRQFIIATDNRLSVVMENHDYR